ncbi:porin [Paraburkholderia sediminicola]|uniref:porin n=1 Tax=Paraburkholderia sediminicola TaxID=458836 RepID=UPI0038B6F049
MKKALLAAMLLSPGFAAHAQSSVTLYGRLDAGLQYVTGVPTGHGANGQATGSTHSFQQESGDGGINLWGLKGVEDLGGGNRIIFQLEGQILLNTGNVAGEPGQLFNRWAALGPSSDRYGTLMLGRELFISNGVWDFDPFWQDPWGSASLVRGRNWPISSNNISYRSPKFGGFEVYGQYSLSNGTSWNGNGTTAQGRGDGIQITYTSALFQIRGIYDEMRNPADGLLHNPYSFSREYTAAANIFLGQFKLQAVYQASRTSHAVTDPGANQPSTSTDLEWGAVTWQATPAAVLIAAVYHVNANHGGGNGSMYTVGGSYNLSRRTLLTFQLATVQNSKTANFSLFANGAGTSAASGNPLVGHSQSGAYAGIQHYF